MATFAATAGGKWVECHTAADSLYYVHSPSGVVSYEKPPDLKTGAKPGSHAGEPSSSSAAPAVGSYIWLRDDAEAWVAATIVSVENDGEVVCQNVKTSRQVVTRQHPTKEPMWRLHPNTLDAGNGEDITLVDDLVMLDELNQAEIIFNLRERYSNNLIYTWVGASKSVLVSVNPFKRLPIYTPQIMDLYARPRPHMPMGPHVFAVANTALRSMQLNELNQAILISGESGAGKTECTKQCLAFLADVCSSGQGAEPVDGDGHSTTIEQRILMANPVLEAYGNAKTLRNNNSSRFGKWIEIHFSKNGRAISGARIDNYLLEKSRLIGQSKGERNYHIFYQLCKSDTYGRHKYSLAPPAMYKYLNQSGCVDADGIDDREEFEELLTAMNSLRFDDGEIDWIFQTTCGVLHLGNATFKGINVVSKDGGQTSGSMHTNEEDVKLAAKFLGVPGEDLMFSMVHRSIRVRGEKSVIPLGPAAAKAATDALAKDVYGRLFDWLVQRINLSIDVDGRASATATATRNFVGVLDIFGFEIFEINSFEQLCINFANEKLQQHFNRHTFKEEEDVYISEGVPYTKVKFIDNQPVLDLIEGKGRGILQMLDEEINMPKGTDLTFINKIERLHNNVHAAFKVEKVKAKSEMTNFTVVHYAGAVKYEADGFCEKNRDKLFPGMVEMLSKSSMESMSTLYAEGASLKRTGGRGTTKSMGGKFRRQLISLMKVLDTCSPQYIRCIKPNHEKRGNKFVNQMCLDQLKFSGVFEAVEIRKTGYPFRYTQQAFANRFRSLTLECNSSFLPEDMAAKGLSLKSILSTKPITDYRGICEEILFSPDKFAGKHLSSQGENNNIQLGKTMVLYRAREHHILELLRTLALDRIVPLCQRVARGSIGRRFFRCVRISVSNLKAAMAKCSAGKAEVDLLEEELRKASEFLGPFHALFPFVPNQIQEAKLLRNRLMEWNEVVQLLKQLVGKDVEEHYDAFGVAIVRAEQVMDSIPHTEETANLYRKHKASLDNCAANRLAPNAEKALYELDVQHMKEISAEAKRVGYQNDDIGQINNILALPENQIVKLQLKKAIELDDPIRKIQRETELKMIFVEKFKSMFVFEKFSKLRDPIDFANSKYFGLAFGKNKIAHGMLLHSKAPIHISLTSMTDRKEGKQAVQLFKNVLGFMGDRRYSSTAPETLAIELLHACVAGSMELKDEILCQVMKQLQQNPDPESSAKGWKLMALLVATISPSEAIENFLVVFLKNHGAGKGKAWISELHRTQHERAITSNDDVMSQGEIRQFLKGFQATTSRRTRFSFVDRGSLVNVQNKFKEQQIKRASSSAPSNDLSKTTSYVRKARQ